MLTTYTDCILENEYVAVFFGLGDFPSHLKNIIPVTFVLPQFSEKTPSVGVFFGTPPI